MAIRNVVQIGDEILRKKSKKVREFDEKLWELLDDMRETMVKFDGVGLAAVQVGILYRMAIVITEEYGIIEIINPVITSAKKQRIDSEGCLSCPGISGRVRRPHLITLDYQDRNGKKHTKIFHGIDAVCCCHEIDHMDGVLFIDKLEND